MKRSEINGLVKRSMAFCKAEKFRLPPFAFWTAAEGKTKGHECDEIRRCMLGWDVTDLGQGEFEKLGLVLFTLRNGDRLHVKRGRYEAAGKAFWDVKHGALVLVQAEAKLNVDARTPRKQRLKAEGEAELRLLTKG